MNKQILQAKKIAKNFSGTVALDEVDFELNEGEVHALVGENGAGKSTFVKILSGIHRADQGEIYLHGKRVEIANPLIAQQLGIAAIYQEPTVFRELSVTENVFMGHQIVHKTTRRINWQKMNTETQRLLASMDLKLNPKTKLKQLSTAEQQLIEIIKALSLNSKILIMDEPTSSLTHKEIEKLFAIIKRLKEQKTTIIFISHRLEEAFAIADRITVFRDGHYIGTRSISEPNLKADDIIKMMVGRELTEIYPKKEVKIGEPFFQVENFTRTGQFYNISFQLRKGEILGISGLVGAGRTELARAILGLEKVDSGQLYLEQKQIKINNPWTALKHGIAYLPEDRQTQGLILQMNLTENITLPILNKFTKMGWVNPEAEIKEAKKYAELLKVKATGLWEKAV